MTRSADSLDGLAFLDIETTGLDAATEEIIEVGVCFVERGSITARRSWLFKPSKALPPLITALTGLTDDDLTGAPPFKDKHEELKLALKGWTLVAHNAAFERSFLGPLVEGASFIDSCEVLHLLFPELPSHGLDALVRWADVGEGARHRALDDAEDTWLVVRAAFARVATTGRREELEQLVRRLTPPQSPDARALVQLLTALATHCGGTAVAPLPAPERLADEALVGRFVSSLEAGGLSTVDVERPVLDAVLEASRRVGAGRGGPITVAVPRTLLRDAVPLATYVPRAQVCRTRLAELINGPTDTDQGRLTRAWLEVWGRRSTHGDLATHSGWMSARLPEARALLELACGCTCHDPRCFVRRTERESDSASVLLVTHELALDWLERAAPLSLVVLSAEALPEAERRRSEVALDVRRLTSLACVTPEPLRARLEQSALWLENTLGVEDWVIDTRARKSRAWLELRDVLLGLQKDLAQSVTQSPALRIMADDVARLLGGAQPSFVLRVHRRSLRLGLTAPTTTLALRLAEAGARGSVVLVAGTRGGSRWAAADHGGPSAWLPPTVVPWSVETVEGPLSLEGAARLAARLSRDTVVSFLSSLPLEQLAAPFRAMPDVPFRLIEASRALRGAGVLLGRWSGQPPPTTNVVLYDLADWRAAVVTCGARDLTLASPTGVPDQVASELADVVASAGLRRVVPLP